MDDTGAWLSQNQIYCQEDSWLSPVMDHKVTILHNSGGSAGVSHPGSIPNKWPTS